MSVTLAVLLCAIALYFLILTCKGEKSSSGKAIFSVVMCVVLSLQLGLRHDLTSADTGNYRHIFSLVELLSWSEVMSSLGWSNSELGDPGYVLLQKVFQIFSVDFQTFLIFTSFCFFIPFFRWQYRYSSSLTGILLSIAIFQLIFFPIVAVVIRQMLAVGVCLVAYDFILKKRLIPFLLLVLGASLIHYSAIVFLPLYFISRVDKPKAFFIAAIVGALCVFPVRFQFAKLIGQMSGHERYAGYADSTDFSRPETLTIFFALIVIGALFRMNNTLRVYPASSFYFLALGCGVVFLPLGWVNPNMMRIAFYFTLYILLLIPATLDTLTESERSVRNSMYFFMIVGIVLLFAYTGRTYYFFWENPPIYSL